MSELVNSNASPSLAGDAGNKSLNRIDDKSIFELCNKRIEHIKNNSISIHDYIVICKYLSGAWWFDLKNGEIYSTFTHKKLKSDKNPSGYLVVRAYFKGADYTISVHRALAIIANGIFNLPSLDMDVDHINGVIDDNRFENLRIITSTKNRCSRGSFSSVSPDVEEAVVDLYEKGLPNVNIAKTCGVSDTTVVNIARRHGIYKYKSKRSKLSVVYGKQSENKENEGDN